MPRKAAVTPNRDIHVWLPADLKTRAELLLYSEVEGRVPKGAWQGLITKLLREYFDHKPLDLSPFLDAMPGVHVITGPVHTLSALLIHLEKERSK